MSKYEVYRARTTSMAALAFANTATPFTIEVRFVGGLTPGQQDAFKLAADRWSRIIIGDLPPVQINGELVDDVVIFAEGRPIDGAGRILGQAGPTYLRPQNAGAAALIPARGIMRFDSADLAKMETDGTLNDVITHEMGHVLGIGTIWSQKNLLQGSGTNNPLFIGAEAMAAYGLLRDGGAPRPVPVENTGGPGTREGHWRESVFATELMSGFIANAGNPISQITVGCLTDMGYLADPAAAEPWQFPDLFALAESGLLMGEDESFEHGVVLPAIPTVLPEDSLQ